MTGKMKKTYTCIVCPMSCRITVEDREDGVEVTGNGCGRGKEYAMNEHTLPKRTLTTTVKVENGRLRRLPVITDSPLPKAKREECLKEIYAVCVQAPVHYGDVVLENVCGTGVDVLASRSVQQKA